MTIRETVDTAGTIVCVALAVLLIVSLFVSRPPAPAASCASLYRLAHTATDSLTVAVSRGDCAP